PQIAMQAFRRMNKDSHAPGAAKRGRDLLAYLSRLAYSGNNDFSAASERFLEEVEGMDQRLLRFGLLKAVHGLEDAFAFQLQDARNFARDFGSVHSAYLALLLCGSQGRIGFVRGLWSGNALFFIQNGHPWPFFRRPKGASGSSRFALAAVGLRHLT